MTNNIIAILNLLVIAAVTGRKNYRSQPTIVKGCVIFLMIVVKFLVMGF